jgi:hypothetical protein
MGTGIGHRIVGKVVRRYGLAVNNSDDKNRRTTCTLPECGREFSYMSNIGLNRIHDLVDSTRKD